MLASVCERDFLSTTGVHHQSNFYTLSLGKPYRHDPPAELVASKRRRVQAVLGGGCSEGKDSCAASFSIGVESAPTALEILILIAWRFLRVEDGGKLEIWDLLQMEVCGNMAKAPFTVLHLRAESIADSARFRTRCGLSDGFMELWGADDTTAYACLVSCVAHTGPVHALRRVAAIQEPLTLM
eukprot:3394935-Amphidinium_carterae.1